MAPRQSKLIVGNLTSSSPPPPSSDLSSWPNIDVVVVAAMPSSTSLGRFTCRVHSACRARYVAVILYHFPSLNRVLTPAAFPSQFPIGRAIETSIRVRSNLPRLIPPRDALDFALAKEAAKTIRTLDHGTASRMGGGREGERK